MIKKNHLLLSFAILIYSAFNSLELIQAWKKAPFEKHVWILFLIWLTPLVWTLGNFRNNVNHTFYNPLFLGIAIFFTFLGVIVSMNALKYIGFAFSLASFVPMHWAAFPWLISSVAWMPALGWMGSRYFPNWVFEIRLFIVLAGVVCWVFFAWKNSNAEAERRKGAKGYHSDS
jgi:hypothetical protein